MLFSEEEQRLLNELKAGKFDGRVGDSVETSGGISYWMVIKNGIPVMYKRMRGGDIFNEPKAERYDSETKVSNRWKTDVEKLAFLKQYGWLMEHSDAVKYSRAEAVI